MEKLHGKINLSAIPKELITRDAKNNAVIWVDVIENFEGKPDQYGSTHKIQVWDKSTGKNITIAYLEKKTFGKAAQPAQAAPAPQRAAQPSYQPAQQNSLEPQESDLPF